MRYEQSQNCAVLDIGKTNVKLHLIGPAGESLMQLSRPNAVINAEPYPHADVEGIWAWLMASLREFASLGVGSISITTHGATAALIDEGASDEGVPDECALALPVLDYEFTGVEDCNDAYQSLRPPFSQSFSPALPAGLNLGRQLFWQAQQFPDLFAKASHILMYPQYWAWRLSGKLCSEVSSLGCHTDLWCPEQSDFSTLVEAMQWRNLFPAIKPAWQCLGVLKPEVAELCGLPNSVKVFAGVHDSNASFLRYKQEKNSQPFTVISTGTWTILMSSGVSLNTLNAEKDMLANVDVEAKPVACARFMGGREYDIICAKFNGRGEFEIDVALLQVLIDQKVMALPDFSGGSGPFGGSESAFLNASDELIKTNGFGAALATLYCAMMMDYQLDMLGAKGDIYIEGAFLQNPLMCAVLASLRQNQTTYLSADSTGTVQGCTELTRWGQGRNALKLERAQEVAFENLNVYRTAWREQVETR